MLDGATERRPSRLALEVMHDRADSVDADPGILGLAVPQPPAQALDFLDDHRLRRRTLRVVGRQVAGDPRQVLQPHGEVKPVQDREFRDASVEEDAPQPGAAVGERGQYRVLCPPDRVEVAADQRHEIRVGLRHGAEDLPSSCRRLDIADPDFQVPLAVLAAADEGRIQGHRDRLDRSCRFEGRRHWQLFSDLEGMTAQGLVSRASVDREHLRQQLSGRPIGQQSGELGPQPVQLRGRADVRRPVHARRGRARSRRSGSGAAGP